MIATGQRILVTLALATGLALAGCESDIDIASSHAALDSDPDGRDDEVPAVDEALVDELPPCASLELGGLPVEVYRVSGSGGLLAVAVGWSFVCVDDAEGLLEAGLEAEAIPPRNHEGDGTPLPANKPTDGTPLPASAIADGTPLPASN